MFPSRNLKRFLILFPGQGSQYVGMAKDLYETSSEARSLFERANTRLEVNLTHMMFDGPEVSILFQREKCMICLNI
jgi:[acyl-carrier-protein] S-malonyltransferase